MENTRKKTEINIKFDYNIPSFVLGDTSQFYSERIIGKKIPQAIEIVSRFDSSMSVANCIALLSAVEQNKGIEINETTKDLREISLKLEIIHSHINHIHKKIIPRVLNLSSFNDYINKNRKEFALGHAILKKSEAASFILNKRFPHPINLGVGGFHKIISEEEKSKILILLKECVPNVIAYVEILAKQRKTLDMTGAFASLWDIQTTPLTFGNIKESEKEPISIPEYFKNEKYLKTKIITGPIARINNSNKLINYTAEKYIKKLGLKFPITNVYAVPLVMCLETIYLLEKAIETLKAMHLDKVAMAKDFETARGLGFSCVETSKGMAYHEYLFGENGEICSTRQVFPLTQNLLALEGLVSSLDLDLDIKTRKEIFEEVRYLKDSFYI